MLLVPLCYEESLSQSWGRSVSLLFFYSLSKLILSSQNISTRLRFLFLILLIYFLRTPFGPREWACGLWIVYLVYLFFSYLSHAFIFFDETCVTISFMYPLQAMNLQTKITA